VISIRHMNEISPESFRWMCTGSIPCWAATFYRGGHVVTLIVGEYKVGPDDMIVREFYPDMAYKNALNSDITFIIYAEAAAINKDDISFLCKNAETNIKIISINNKLFKGIRASKNVKKLFDDGGGDDNNPFDITKAILTNSHRNEVFEFLSLNKVNLFMPIKIMISNMLQLSRKNQAMVAYLDSRLFKVDTNILYALIAYRMEVETYLQHLYWNFPKKKEET